jgi:hypothetical protein
MELTGFHQTVTWRLAELEGRLAEGRPAAGDPALVEALAVEAAALVSDFPAKDRAALPRRIEAARARIEELALPLVFVQTALYFEEAA